MILLNMEIQKVRRREVFAALRESDLKADQLERRVAALEEQREEWERKNEELTVKYEDAKKELDEIAASLENL